MLVTSAGGKVSTLKLAGLNVKKFANLDLLAGDANANVLAANIGVNFWHMPKTGDGSLEEIIQGLLAREVRLVIPTRDSELPFWARSASRLQDLGISVAVSSLEGVEVCLDKIEFSAWGARANQPVIPSALSVRHQDWNPVVAKERFGAGSNGVSINQSQLSAEEFAKSLDSPIFQPFIQGWEISVDSWFDRDGKLYGFVMRSRDLVRSGESQITTTFRHEGLEKLVGSALQVAGAQLHLRGPIVMQAIVSNGKIHIIEVNARIGGASSASAEVGLDLIGLSILEAMNPLTRFPEFARRNFEVRQLRSPEDRHIRVPNRGLEFEI